MQSGSSCYVQAGQTVSPKRHLRLVRSNESRREFPLTSNEFIQKLLEMACSCSDFGLEKKALHVVFDGPNKSGKSSAARAIGLLLNSNELKPLFFKESRYADQRAESRRRDFFNRFGLYGGDPIERLTHVCDVRYSALFNPDFQGSLQDPYAVILHDRSFITTAALQAFATLNLSHRDAEDKRRVLKRDRLRFIEHVFDKMYGTFYLPDLGFVFNCSPETANKRIVAAGKEVREFPPRRVYEAYDYVTEGLIGSRFGDVVTPDMQHITGNGRYFRVFTDVPKTEDENTFYQKTNETIFRLILDRFNETLEYRLKKT